MINLDRVQDHQMIIMGQDIMDLMDHMDHMDLMDQNIMDQGITNQDIMDQNIMDQNIMDQDIMDQDIMDQDLMGLMDLTGHTDHMGLDHMEGQNLEIDLKDQDLEINQDQDIDHMDQDLDHMD